MGSRKWVLAPLLTVLLTASWAMAQPDVPDLPDVAEPEVQMDDVELEGPIVPQERGTADFQVSVGCEPTEVPGTITQLLIQPEDAPPWAFVRFAPAILQWEAESGDCPATEAPFEGTVRASVRPTGDAPAYEQAQATILATVEKISPGTGENRSYGPYEAGLSFSTGYLHQQNVVFDRQSEAAGHNETIRFEGEVRSQSNHEASYRIEVADTTPATETTVEPSTLVLEPDESGAFAVETRLADPEADAGEQVEIEVTVTGEPTHPEGGEGGSSTVSLQADFQAPETREGDGQDLPAPGAAWLAAVACLAALVLRRPGTRDR